MKAYHRLEEIFNKSNNIKGAQSLLSWDSAVNMPVQSSEARGKVQATLKQLEYETIANDQVGDLLSEAEGYKMALSIWQQANLREMRHTYSHMRSVPVDLTTKLTVAANTCEILWRKARQDSNFKLVLPKFKEFLSLTKEKATCKAESLGIAKYDALLDCYDQGSRTRDLDPIFKTLREFLGDFIKQVKTRQQPKPALKLALSLPYQKQLGKKLMDSMGFNFEKARLDESTHPFCSGTPDDIRITTRYTKDDFTIGLQGILHETGHALYEQNLPKKWRNQPVGSACGMTAHESQSLFVEMQLCRSSAFISYLVKTTNKTSLPANDLYSYINYVEPTFIRVESDEVTYPMHIIMRYELEKLLISGELQVEDLPDAWNDSIYKLLGIRPKTDSDGCLQDIHWYGLDFGYFPCYTLGAMAAAQLMATLKKEVKDIEELIGTGNFKPIIAWLTEKVHKHGSYYSRNDLLKNATGEPLNPSHFIAYLQNKYIG
jgi:carboxypeptidase Taq